MGGRAESPSVCRRPVVRPGYEVDGASPEECRHRNVVPNSRTPGWATGPLHALSGQGLAAREMSPRLPRESQGAGRMTGTLRGRSRDAL